MKKTFLIRDSELLPFTSIEGKSNREIEILKKAGVPIDRVLATYKPIWGGTLYEWEEKE